MPPSDGVAVVKVPPGVRITARMPDPEERDYFGMPDVGVPVLVVVIPGDRFTVEVVDDE